MTWSKVNQLIRKISTQMQIVDRSMSSGIKIFREGPYDTVSIYRTVVRQHAPLLMDKTS